MILGIEFGNSEPTKLDVRRWAPPGTPNAMLLLHISRRLEHRPSVGGLEPQQRRLQGGERHQGRHHYRDRLDSGKAFTSDSTDHVPRCLSPQGSRNAARHTIVAPKPHPRCLNPL